MHQIAQIHRWITHIHYQIHWIRPDHSGDRRPRIQHGVLSACEHSCSDKQILEEVMRSIIHRAAAILLPQCTFRSTHDPRPCRAYWSQGTRLGQVPHAAARSFLPATFGNSWLPYVSDGRLWSSSSSDDEELFDTSIRPYEKLDVPRTYIVRKKGHDVISGVFNF